MSNQLRDGVFIKTRPDLRKEPHGWRLPKAVRVKVTCEAVE